VRVNGAKITSPTPLRDGDEIQIGDYRIALRGDHASASPSMADRPTMPSIPAVMGPMATVGGSVAIPTRASVAAMAAQPVTPTPNPSAPPLTSAAAVARSSGSRTAVGAAASAAVPADVSPVAPFPAALTPAPEPLVNPAGVPAPKAAPEVFEAQPTIPIRALSDADDPRPAARLCALTTDVAGTMYALDRASLVIGRTDENDVVIPHRSISRHHAKIVRDADHYTILDLQSANGVRVNGEDYERIELNPGDIIELGHVKLRFVAANESYAFDGRATGVAGGAPTRLVVLGVAAAAVVAGLVVAVIHRGQRGSAAGEAGNGSAVAAMPATAAPSVAVAADDAAAAAAEAPAVPPPTPEAVLADARAAAAAEDWDKARAALDRLGSNVADPGDRREAQSLRRQVDTEHEAALAFGHLNEAMAGKNFADALDRYQEIPPESVYKPRARPKFEQARTAVIAEHLASAEHARAAGRCPDVHTEAEEVFKLDPRNLVARELVRLCRPHGEPAPVAARPAARARVGAVLAGDSRMEGSAPKRSAESGRADKHAEAGRAESARAEATRPEATRSEGADDDAPDPDALMKQAREAWMRQQCGAAMDLSRKALHAKPGMTDAYQIIAVCSCTLRDSDGAGRAYAKLDDKNRNLVRAVCQKNGVALGD